MSASLRTLAAQLAARQVSSVELCQDYLARIKTHNPRLNAFISVDEERTLPHRHLIAQNIANFRLAVNEDDLVPEASILNFHYAYPEVMDWNRGLRRAIGYVARAIVGKTSGDEVEVADPGGIKAYEIVEVRYV